MAKKKSAAAKKKAAAAATSGVDGSNGNAEANGANGHHDSGDDDASAGETSFSSARDSPSTSLPSTFTFSMDLDGLTPTQKAEKEKAEGNVKFKAGQYQEAIDLYSEAIEHDPGQSSYYTNRAAASMAIRKHTSALADCQKAASLQASAPQAKTLSRLARCQLALGRIDEASRTLSDALQLEPTNAAALQDQRRIEVVRTHLANVAREISKNEWTYVLYGLDGMEKEVEHPPVQWKVWRIQGYLARKRIEDAAMLASDLLRANQSDPDVLWARGLVLFTQGSSAQAIAHAQAALRNDPDHTPARLLLKKVRQMDSTKEAGNDLFKRGQWQPAIEKYTECIEMLEEQHEAMRITLLSNRATAYLKANQHSQAIEDATWILGRDSKHFKALRTRARANLAQEAFEAAIADFASAYQEAPAGSAEERAMKTEHRQAEVALKRSKTVDHYKVLSVERTATEVEIKKAYRKASLIHHPDKGGSEEEFKKVSEAYAVLSDGQRRRRYDLGEDDDDSGMGGGGGFHHHPFASAFGGGGGFGGGGFGGGGFDGGGINLEDLLNGGRGARHSYGF